MQRLRPFGIALLLNAVLFALFFLVATPAYETNDDHVMEMIASGFYTGEPSEYLVFTHVIVGWGLRTLYETWGGCNWYFYYLVTVHFLSLTAIAFVLLSGRGGWFPLFLYVGFFLFVETRILLRMQFTTTAFLAGTAGILLLVDALRPDRQACWLKALAALVFAAVMTMIREPVALLLALIAVPFVIERVGVNRWRRLAAVGLAYGSMFATLHAVQNWYYHRDPAWAKFSDYNGARSEIHDTPLTKRLPEAASSVGWTQNDVWLFSRFYIGDVDTFGNVATLKNLLGELRSKAGMNAGLPLQEPLNSRVIDRDASVLLKLSVVNAVCLILFGSSLRQRYFVTLLVCFGLILGLYYYLVQTAKLPERVSYNMPLFIHAAILYWVSRPSGGTATLRAEGWLARMCPSFNRREILGPARIILILGWVALCASLLVQLFSSLAYSDAFNRNLREKSGRIFGLVEAAFASESTPVLVSIPPSPTLEQCLFFRPPSEAVPFLLVPAGWLTHSPLFVQIQNRCGLQSSQLSLVNRSNVCFLMDSRWIEPLETYYREHHGLNVGFETVVDTDEMPEYRTYNVHIYRAFGRDLGFAGSAPATSLSTAAQLVGSNATGEVAILPRME